MSFAARLAYFIRSSLSSFQLARPTSCSARLCVATIWVASMPSSGVLGAMAFIIAAPSFQSSTWVLSGFPTLPAELPAWPRSRFWRRGSGVPEARRHLTRASPGGSANSYGPLPPSGRSRSRGARAPLSQSVALRSSSSRDMAVRRLPSVGDCVTAPAATMGSSGIVAARRRGVVREQPAASAARRFGVFTADPVPIRCPNHGNQRALRGARSAKRQGFSFHYDPSSPRLPGSIPAASTVSAPVRMAAVHCDRRYRRRRTGRVFRVEEGGWLPPSSTAPSLGNDHAPRPDRRERSIRALRLAVHGHDDALLRRAGSLAQRERIAAAQEVAALFGVEREGHAAPRVGGLAGVDGLAVVPKLDLPGPIATQGTRRPYAEPHGERRVGRQLRGG